MKLQLIQIIRKNELKLEDFLFYFVLFILLASYFINAVYCEWGLLCFKLTLSVAYSILLHEKWKYRE